MVLHPTPLPSFISFNLLKLEKNNFIFDEMIDKDTTTSAIIHFTYVLSVALVTVALYEFHRIHWGLCPHNLKEKDLLGISLTRAHCL